MLNVQSQVHLYPRGLDALYRCPMTLGSRLRQLRRLLGLTQEKIAELCEVSKSAVSQWESNDTRPELENLLRLRSAHAFSLDWLLTGLGEIRGTIPLKAAQQKLLHVAEDLPDYAVDHLIEEGHTYAELIQRSERKTGGGRSGG